MATHKDVHEFAILWAKKYRNPCTKEHDVEAGFGDECFSLGFIMDTGNSIQAAFPLDNILYSYEAFENIIEQVQDVNLLCSAIFSKWRYITHWTNYEQLLSAKNRQWFILAFERLAKLTAED